MSRIAPDEVEDVVNLLRNKIGKHSREDLEAATDAVNKLGSAFLRLDEQTLHSLRLPQEMMRHSLVDTLLDLVLAASPVLDEVESYFRLAISSNEMIEGSLLLQRLFCTSKSHRGSRKRSYGNTDYSKLTLQKVERGDDKG